MVRFPYRSRSLQNFHGWPDALLALSQSTAMMKSSNGLTVAPTRIGITKSNVGYTNTSASILKFQNVLQADIRSQNLLDMNDDLKFTDFAGSSIDGEDAYVSASARAHGRSLCSWQFPDTRHLILGPVIKKCWKMQYEDVAEVLDDLRYLKERPS
ncbi:hypothetical protein TSTA_006310 [Talaromyces stipitatus ATCC 10500]|uniref:Uncharacterized protein n=1 Tax=Talaromyces stipitatus (strain ATCC 10500 / CBS 375.48 / QM 6759 / NRRL 1006) TaxID=441959 RepID=B8MSS3_TALSN|nr:uncharacterized protein TSTA_006310 [Talaromyces stipitatus ATCC 10500]EED12605.1 hypothetical protein TSTA_006310 [Talaromyces stipitatus ATCC 10500]